MACGQRALELHGYNNPDAGGILLPENHWTHDFCSPGCFLDWMRSNLKLDHRSSDHKPYSPRKIT